MFIEYRTSDTKNEIHFLYRHTCPDAQSATEMAEKLTPVLRIKYLLADLYPERDSVILETADKSKGGELSAFLNEILELMD